MLSEVNGMYDTSTRSGRVQELELGRKARMCRSFYTLNDEKDSKVHLDFHACTTSIQSQVLILSGLHTKFAAVTTKRVSAPFEVEDWSAQRARQEQGCYTFVKNGGCDIDNPS